MPFPFAFNMNSINTEIKVESIGTLSILDIVTNSIVFAVIVKYPQLGEDRTNLFMLSLMISDILYGTLVMPISAVLCSSASQSVLAVMPYLTKVQMLLSRWIVTVSLNSLSWVTLCKMIAITKPFTFERHLNSIRCYIIIALIWSIASLIAVASFRKKVNWSIIRVCRQYTLLLRSNRGHWFGMHKYSSRFTECLRHR